MCAKPGKEKWRLSETEKIAEATALKAKGTNAFKAEKWTDAQVNQMTDNGPRRNRVWAQFVDEYLFPYLETAHYVCRGRPSQCAKEIYGDAADYVEGDFVDEALAAEAKAIRISCLLNQSQCALKRGEWFQVCRWMRHE